MYAYLITKERETQEQKNAKSPYLLKYSTIPSMQSMKHMAQRARHASTARSGRVQSDVTGGAPKLRLTMTIAVRIVFRDLQNDLDQLEYGDYQRAERYGPQRER